MLADPTDSDAAKKALVRTYNPPGYADPWDCITDYERVQRAAAEHPDKGSAALSSVVDLPRGRIRPWLDGAQPDCYRGLQTAQERGWILDTWSSDEARALNRLAAWVLASGSIDATNWVAAFVVDDPDHDAPLIECFDTFDLRPRIVERDDKPPEYIPREDASVLGRVLFTWSGVRGDKAPLETRFPQYLQFAPVGIVRQFLATYARLRGIVREPGARLQIQAHRSDRFRNDLVAALARVVDADDIRSESWPIYLVDEAVDHLSETTFKNR